MNFTTVDRIRGLVEHIKADARKFGVLSTGEKIAVALVMNRTDWLNEAGWPSVLEAVERLGPEWLAAALQVQRDLE
jgi:hypothetical protein